MILGRVRTLQISGVRDTLNPARIRASVSEVDFGSHFPDDNSVVSRSLTLDNVGGPFSGNISIGPITGSKGYFRAGFFETDSFPVTVDVRFIKVFQGDDLEGTREAHVVLHVGDQTITLRLVAYLKLLPAEILREYDYDTPTHYSPEYPVPSQLKNHTPNWKESGDWHDGPLLLVFPFVLIEVFVVKPLVWLLKLPGRLFSHRSDDDFDL